MYVCICNAVTERDIVEAARNGACTMEALCHQLKVATCCGQCADCAHSVLQQAIESPALEPISA